MLNGLLARKIGMTQIFEEDGTVLPVTVLQSGPMTVVQKKTLDKKDSGPCLGLGAFLCKIGLRPGPIPGEPVSKEQSARTKK